MKKLQITPDQLQRANKHYEFGALNGSITQGKSNIFGALGEIIVYDYFKEKGQAEIKNTFDYDLIINGYRVDVKTKKTTVEPKPGYYCSIAGFNTRQDCDYYFFARITADLKTGYLLGYLPKYKFMQQAIFKKKGEIDTNGFVFKSDCYNLEMENLTGFNLN